jgi:nicotinate-nucleotide adenylyltransferase
VTGADAFAGIHTWHRAAELLDRVTFVVVSRPGHPAPALRAQLATLAPRMCTPSDWATRAGASIVLVDASTSPVSSTMVRAAVAAGQSLSGLVPAPVASYIAAHGLYR